MVHSTVRTHLPALLLGAALSMLAATPAAAQVPSTVDSLRLEVQRLQARVNSLLRAMQAQPPASAADTAADPLAAVRAAAAAAVAAGAAADTAAAPAQAQTQFVSRQRNLNALNPEISVSGDVLAFVNSDDETTDNFVPREFEVSFQSSLDPFSRGKIFVAHHEHGGEMLPFPEDDEAGAGSDEHESGEVEIEEGYVEWIGVLGGLNLTLGKFRQRFGKLNRWHTHSLPAQQLPLPYLAYLGAEGLAQTGVSLHWLLPVHGIGTWEVWGELTRSSSETVFGESHGPSGLGHINAFWQLSPATYFEVGGSALMGDREVDEIGEGDARVYGVDFTLDWTPPDQALYRGARLHGGWMVSRRGVDGFDDSTANGGYVIGEYKLGRQWIVGARYEFVEHPDDPDERAWLAGPTLTWWQSEFVRIRAEYAVMDRPGGRFGQLILQTTFAMGPHKHETY